MAKKDWELVFLATIVDTFSFHSTKKVNADYILIKSICEKYQLDDYDKLYDVVLCLKRLANLEEN